MGQLINVDRQGGFLENMAQVLLARVADDDGNPAIIATFSTIKYEIWDINTVNLPVQRGATVTAVVADVMFNSLQLSDSWTTDDIGFNFALILGNADIPPAAKTIYPAGIFYSVEVQFTTTGGNIFLGAFQGEAKNMLFGK